MNLTEYLERVKAQSIDDNLTEKLALLNDNFPNNNELENIIEHAECFLIDWKNGYLGIPEFYPLEEIKHFFSKTEREVHNWFYDRKAKVLLVNLRMSCHENIAAKLYNLYANKLNDPRSIEQIEDAAEALIDEGLAWFKSSSSYGRVLIGKNVKLTADEKLAFSTFTFIGME